MNEERLLKILLSPHVSEKASGAADRDRQFVFRVAPDANKQEIKSAVEHLFNVQVKSVQVLNTRGKARRSGAVKGWRSGFRKAYVALKPGFDIDFMGPQ